ncbi:MAG: MATE family efflux transporter, partial [Phycisphaerae bacterium]
IRLESTGHLFMSLAIVGSAALRGAGDMRTPMLIFAAVNAVNIVASCTFVYVLKLGVNGIVFGTVTARMVGGVLIVAVLARGRAGMLLRRRELGILWPRTRRILRIGVPAAVDGAIMWLGHVALLAVVGRVAAGQIAFAAHIIAVRVEALTYLPAVAWGTATATMVGQALGAGDRRRAMRSGLEAVLQCGVFSLVVAVVFYAGADWIYAQMSRNLEVGAMGVGPFRVLAVLQPTMVVSIVLVWGLRGAGDTRVPMLITIVGIVIRLSAGYYFGIVKEGGLMGAWMGMFGDMIWRAAATAVRYVRGRWLETSV